MKRDSLLVTGLGQCGGILADMLKQVNKRYTTLYVNSSLGDTEQYWKALMYMGKQDGITLYKHCNTRMYINVDKDGRFYKYNGKGYDEIGKDDTISHMLS